MQDVSDVIEVAFAVESTQARYQKAHDMIRPYVVGEQGEQAGYTHLSSDQAFDDALTYLLDHVQQRRDDALEFLALYLNQQ